jgi:hypothetical protein
MTAIDYPVVEVFGKANCPNCEDFKEYLTEKSIPHKAHDMEYHAKYHPQWRDDGSVDALAAYQYIPVLPMVKIEEDFYTVEQAQAILEDVTKAGIAS